ncbi:MAG: helix-turn-helix transcriptional regulator [Thermoanaerobaculia bacterium]
MQRLLTTVEAAEALGGLSRRTLEGWRRKRIGPPYVRLGHGPTARVRYRPSDLEAWVSGLGPEGLGSGPRRAASAGVGR